MSNVEIRPRMSRILGPNTTIVAHSLGNVLVSSMIQDHGVQVGNYVMLNPAVPTEAYDGRTPLSDPDPSDRHNMTHPDWKTPKSGSQDYPERVMAAEWSKLFSPFDARSHVTWDGRFADVLNNPGIKVWQFYSQGEEILRKAESTMPKMIDMAWFIPFWESTESLAGAREWTWVYHEMTKGVLYPPYATLVPRHRNAGWAFGPRRHRIQDGVDNNGNPIYRRAQRNPADAALITTADLIASPYFKRFDPDAHKNISLWRQNYRWMYDPDGDYSIPEFLQSLPTQNPNMEKMKVHAKLLAEMIPPLSSPAGGTRLIKFADEQNNPFKDRAKDLMDYRNLTLWDSANRPDKSTPQKNGKRWLHGDYKDAPYLLTYKLYEQIRKITHGEGDPP